MTRTLLALLATTLLAGSLSACGRYGPPQPYPSGVETPDDEDDQG